MWSPSSWLPFLSSVSSVQNCAVGREGSRRVLQITWSTTNGPPARRSVQCSPVDWVKDAEAKANRRNRRGWVTAVRSLARSLEGYASALAGALAGGVAAGVPAWRAAPGTGRRSESASSASTEGAALTLLGHQRTPGGGVLRHGGRSVLGASPAPDQRTDDGAVLAAPTCQSSRLRGIRCPTYPRGAGRTDQPIALASRADEPAMGAAPSILPAESLSPAAFRARPTQAGLIKAVVLRCPGGYEARMRVEGSVTMASPQLSLRRQGA